MTASDRLVHLGPVVVLASIFLMRIEPTRIFHHKRSANGQSETWVLKLILTSLLVWEYLRSPAKNLSFFAGHLRLAMMGIQSYIIDVLIWSITGGLIFKRGNHQKMGVVS